MRGTASWANSASVSISSSFATTASYAMNAGGVPGGLNTQIQFNANNVFSGSPNFTFNSGSNTLTITGSLVVTDSLSQGFNVQVIGDYSHAEGSNNTTGIKNALYATSVSSGVIIISSSYGNSLASFPPNSIILLYDKPFDNVIGRGIFIVSQSYYINPNTIIKLYDTSINTTTAFIYRADGDIAIGEQVIPGNISHAEGEVTIALGIASHAEGTSTKAIGDYSHTEGYFTLAIGGNSHAEGEATHAVGYTSHAEGLNTNANGDYSHAEGNGTSANGNNSHAEGNSTIASGSSSHTEGNSTTAFGNNSHAEGVGTITIGDGSHAEGFQTRTIAEYSHAAGISTVASGSYQSVIGAYNISSSVQSAFIIGNGTSNSNRSNLLFTSASTIQITGSLIVSGSITGSLFGTASYATTASYVVTALTASYVTSSNIVGTVLSSSYAATASYVVTALTASYVTASNVVGTILSASYAQTASYVLNAQTASFATTASIASSVVGATPTEIGYLSGVTNPIQTQIDNKGYTLALTALVGNLNNGTTYYFGNVGRAPLTTADVSRVYIPKTGTIKKAYIGHYSSTSGSINSISASMRLNNATDTLIAVSTASAFFRTYNNNALSINVTEGDYFEIKVIASSSVAPGNNVFGGTIYIE